MIKIKTSEATGLQLDWGLGLAIGYTQLTLQVAGKVYGTAPDGGREQIDHTAPAVCMGLIKEYRAFISQYHEYTEVTVWYALDSSDDPDYDSRSEVGDTVEQAVARCVIAMRLGDEFECPSELGVMS